MTKTQNGGYYAIKGFLYQFDKALIEILENPDVKIKIEQIQDINYVNYVIQVKHKETQDYSDSKIKNAVTQLLELFKEDKTQKFRLYCHFKDKAPAKWKLTIEELRKILGNKSPDYLDYLKNEFIENFIIQFSDNYELQFLHLIDLIASSFSLSNKDKAYLYHSIFRSKLLDISIKNISKREVQKKDLEGFVTDSEKIIFFDSYSNYLGRRNYEKLIKKEYFTFNTANIDNFQRLFIIDCIEDINLVDINKIVNCISYKYFRPNKSPQPYICFLNLNKEKEISLKQELIDQGIIFNDGTNFNGDRFRLDKILEDNIHDERIKIKIIDFVNLDKILSKIIIKECFQFYIHNSIEIKSVQKHISIQIEETNQILKVIH